MRPSDEVAIALKKAGLEPNVFGRWFSFKIGSMNSELDGNVFIGQITGARLVSDEIWLFTNITYIPQWGQFHLCHSPKYDNCWCLVNDGTANFFGELELW